MDPRLSAESLQEGVVPLQSEGGVLDDGAAARVLEPLHAPEHGGLARGVVQHDVALVAETEGEDLVLLSYVALNKWQTYSLLLGEVPHQHAQ